MAVSIKSASKPCRLVKILCVMGLGVLSACANPEPGAEYLDPYEVDNRAVHEANKQLDREFVRPVAAAYGRIVPVPVQRGVSNFSNNLDTPGLMVNNLLQFDIANLARNGLRFAVNTTVGIAGLFDPASSMGISRKDTDFTPRILTLNVKKLLRWPWAGAGRRRRECAPGGRKISRRVESTLPVPSYSTTPSHFARCKDTKKNSNKKI